MTSPILSNRIKEAVLFHEAAIHNREVAKHETEEKTETVHEGRIYRFFKGAYSFLTSTVGIITTIALAALALGVYIYLDNRSKKLELIQAFHQIAQSLFQKFRENNDKEMAGYELLEAEFEQIPATQAIESDMIIFPKGYKGAMPLNGIRAEELEKINKIRPEKLFTIQGTPAFKTRIQDLFQILKTRPTGRALLIALSEHHHLSPFDLSIMEDPESSHISSTPLFSTIKIKVGAPSLRKTTNSKGQKKLFADQDFNTSLAMTLGHELIHFFHHQKGTWARHSLLPTIDPNYTNLEEQQTISGWGKKLLSPPQTSAVEEIRMRNASQEELNLLFNENVVADFQNINENNLRSEFSLDHRIDHIGLKAPKNLTLLPNQPIPLEILGHLNTLITENLEIDFENFLKINKHIDLNKLSIGYRSFVSYIFDTLFYDAIYKNQTQTRIPIENFLTALLKSCKKLNFNDAKYLKGLIGQSTLSEQVKRSLLEYCK